MRGAGVEGGLYIRKELEGMARARAITCRSGPHRRERSPNWPFGSSAIAEQRRPDSGQGSPLALPTGSSSSVQPRGAGALRATPAGGAAARGALLVRSPPARGGLRCCQSPNLPHGRAHPLGAAAGRGAMRGAVPNLRAVCGKPLLAALGRALQRPAQGTATQPPTFLLRLPRRPRRSLLLSDRGTVRPGRGGSVV